MRSRAPKPLEIQLTLCKALQAVRPSKQAVLTEAARLLLTSTPVSLYPAGRELCSVPKAKSTSLLLRSMFADDERQAVAWSRLPPASTQAVCPRQEGAGT